MPVAVGIVFIIGLIASAYSAAGSAMTSLTTSFTVDILDAPSRQQEAELGRTRRRVHLMMGVIMGAVIIAFYHISDSDAISAVYTLASYTYGYILGLFAFGLLSKRTVRDGAVPAVCICAPLLAWAVQECLNRVWIYETGFELLIINALLTMAGLQLTSLNTQKVNQYVS